MRNVKTNNKSSIRRKCDCCKQDLYINIENINDAIYYDKKTYHSSCFVNVANQKSQDKRKNICQKWSWIKDNMESIKQESYKHIKEAVVKENINDFIKEAYDITIVPTNIFQKLADIYNGSFKNMGVCIPPEHLLDMWQRKIDMLNGIADRNKTKNIHMDTFQRLSYDLSILVNKYDSYLKWLEKQKIIAAEKETEKNENIVGKSISYIHQKSVKNESDDISTLVDDIFG